MQSYVVLLYYAELSWTDLGPVSLIIGFGSLHTCLILEICIQHHLCCLSLPSKLLLALAKSW